MSLNANEFHNNLVEHFEWHWPEFKTEFLGSINIGPRSDGQRLYIRIHIPELPVGSKPVLLEADRILKLSGVAFYGLRRITFGGVKLKKEIKQRYINLFTEKFFLWRWAYKPTERFVGSVVDGREQGVLLIYSPGEEKP